MAAHGLFNATDLEPLLAERGINLSSVQVWRLVTQTPERLSLPVLAALCDIFEVTPDRADRHHRPQHAAPARPPPATAGGEVTDPDALRPRPRPAAAPAMTRRPRAGGTCGRCARDRCPAASFPDGYLCSTCLQARPGHPRHLPRLRHHPGTARPPPRRRPHLPRLRRDHPPLQLPALRLRRQPGRRAALPPLRRRPRPHRLLGDGTGHRPGLAPLAAALRRQHPTRRRPPAGCAAAHPRPCSPTWPPAACP